MRDADISPRVMRVSLLWRYLPRGSKTYDTPEICCRVDGCDSRLQTDGWMVGLKGEKEGSVCAPEIDAPFHASLRNRLCCQFGNYSS